MKDIIWPSPLYEFIRLVEPAPLEKTVLDCGAGGSRPPLALFASHGYSAYGIDLSADQLQKAMAFAQQHNLALNLREADMRAIPFPDNSFSYVYTYESLCHLTKSDIAVAVNEMTRVLRPGGYCLIDFMSTDCSYYGASSLGQETAPGQFQYSDSDGHQVVHTFHHDNEPGPLFSSLQILLIQKIRTQSFQSKEAITHARLYYFAQNPQNSDQLD
ncbi:MAG: class I SAM-dependent methyltransferase [Promethearchaeota archaeon]